MTDLFAGAEGCRESPGLNECPCVKVEGPLRIYAHDLQKQVIVRILGVVLVRIVAKEVTIRCLEQSLELVASLAMSRAPLQSVRLFRGKQKDSEEA